MKSKIVLNVVLLIAAVGLAISTYNSIMSPIEFNNAYEERDSVTIKRLLDIKAAQEVYFECHNGKYAPHIDTLMNFVKEGQVANVKKVYELNTKQYDQLRKIEMRNKHLATIEEVNMDMNKADQLFMEIRDGYLRESAKGYKGSKQNTADYNDLLSFTDRDVKPTIEDFRRDTTMVPAIKKIMELRPNFEADSMCYIPFSKDKKTGKIKKFVIETNYNNSLFQAYADFEDYLQGINDKELEIFILEKKKEVSQIRKEYVYEDDKVTRKRFINSKGEEEDMFNAIPCRKIGDIEKSNNNAGNWE